MSERLEDLLSAAEEYLGSDDFRVLYYANEALQLAETRDLAAFQFRALKLVIDVLIANDRAADATPYIGRAIDLAEMAPDSEARASLVEMLGTWAVRMEREPGSAATHDWRDRSPVNWARAMIARLERYQSNSESQREYLGDRTELEIDDFETGLLNALGFAAELLTLEDQQIDYALIQMRLVDVDDFRFAESARRAAQMVGDRGLVARNGDAVLTALLPACTGIAAMAMAEHLRNALAKIVTDTEGKIGIGVAIKQPGETGREVLRRVVDRAEEAVAQPGVTVSG
jgi:GGDEF domain-containing protein